MKLLALVALGGAAGAVARYGVGGWIHGMTGAGFPWGTFVVNVAGCSILGLLMPLLQASVATPEARAFLAVGVLGGFTTFSTFSFESVALVQDGQWVRAAAYTLGSVGFGLAAAFAGFWLGTALLHWRA